MNKRSKRPSHSCGLTEQDLEPGVRSLQTRHERMCDCSDHVRGGKPLVDAVEVERRARRIIRIRRRCKELFSSDLFGEPAWDMLLELYASELVGRPASASGVCGDSGVALSTALRWIKMLENNGWVTRLPDQADPPQSFLSLTDKSKVAMERFFAQPDLANF